MHVDGCAVISREGRGPGEGVALPLTAVHHWLMGLQQPHIDGVTKTSTRCTPRYLAVTEWGPRTLLSCITVSCPGHRQTMP